MTSPNGLLVRCIVVVLLFWGFLLDAFTIGSEQKLSVNSIDLLFSPVSVQPFKKAQPKKTWIEVKAVKIQSTPRREASVLLYVDPETNSVAETHAFLEDHGTLYELGFISSFGSDDVQIIETNWQRDANRQWELHGVFGAAADCLKIVAFDRKKNRWVFLLNESANLTGELDLDGDGQNEVVTRFGAAADVTIYRWRQNHFESVDIAKALGSHYAQLFQSDGKWFVEAGKHGKGAVRFFRYVQGKLVRVDLSPGVNARKYF